MSSDGTLEGKWAYVWADESFLGIWPEEEVKAISMTDSKIDSIASAGKSFKAMDLVPGRVYDVCKENGDLSSVTRMVYLGMLDNVLDLDSVKAFLRRRSMLDSFSYSMGDGGYDMTLARVSDKLDGIEDIKYSSCSWLDKDYIKSAKKALKRHSRVPVFLKLVDMIAKKPSALPKHWSFYYEDLVSLPASRVENSVLLDLSKSSLVYGSKIVKRATRESKD